jgi:hypothetical protein
MWFWTLCRRLLERGDFSSVDHLEEQLLAFISAYNERDAHPIPLDLHRSPSGRLMGHELTGTTTSW